MKERIQTLDGLRGVAILMVVLSHAALSMPTSWWTWLTPFTGFFNGLIGVQIFFVLSGYLITSILIREYDVAGKIDVKAFYCRRILRIFPAFYLYLGFIILLNVEGIVHITVPLLAFAAAHLLNYQHAIELLFSFPETPCPGYAFIGHFWSLSMEEQFYWLWPVTLLFLLRTRWYGICGVVILALPLIRIATYFLFPGLRGQVGMMLHTGSDGIVCGCFLALLLARHPDWCRKLLLSPWAVGGLVFYLFAVDPCLAKVLPRAFEVVAGTTLIVVVVALLIANMLLQQGAWYHGVLGSRVLVFLGRISYSLYLWQQIFFTDLDTTFLGKWPMNLAAALLAGWLSYRFVERPFIRLKNVYFSSER